MGHEQSKKRINEEAEKKKQAEKEKEAEERKAHVLKEFHRHADEVTASIMTLKGHFTEPIGDSLVDEYFNLMHNLSRTCYFYEIIRRNGYEDTPFDDRISMVLTLGVRFNETRPHIVEGHLLENSEIDELIKMISAIEKENKMRGIRARENRKHHLYDAFEIVYKRGDASQEELDKAYYAFAKEVCSYLRSHESDYRSGTLSEAMAWDREETEIENEFKKRFPNYNPPCILNQAEDKPACCKCYYVAEEKKE